MHYATIFATLTFIFTLSITSGHEACVDFSGAIDVTNNFCSTYSGHTCCSTDQDSSLQTLYNGLTINDQTCKNFIQQTICASCDPWGAHLFDSEFGQEKAFPVLCPDYCTSFYSACAGVSINWPAGQNPFNSSIDILQNQFPTRDSFCTYVAPVSAQAACYSGVKFVPEAAPAVPPGSSQICLEYFGASANNPNDILKLTDPHDNSNRLFAINQNGQATVLNKQTGAQISVLLSVNTIANGEAGLIGLVAHPNFASNGLFYVYYSSSQPAYCEDDDWCNGNTCGSNGFCSGNYMTNILEEYHVATGSNTADTAPVRTILTVSKPFNNHNGGDLTFGTDGFLYWGTGDGGDANDPYNNAQNLNRRLGKILRIDVDSTEYVSGRKYAVPTSNPGLSTKFPEIYAYGLRNPWRMSFDPFNPSYLLVADVGQDFVEEVNLVVKGANYGWPKYEGTALTITKPGADNIIVDNPQWPVAQYFHNQTGSQGPAIVGGYVYSGTADPCNYGKYIFQDWTNIVWSMYESPAGSGQYVFDQSQRYQMLCTGSNCFQGSSNGLGNIASMSVDDEHNLYILSLNGVHRVVEPSRCGITCTATIQTATTASPTPTTTNVTPVQNANSGNSGTNNSGNSGSSGTNNSGNSGNTSNGNSGNTGTSNGSSGNTSNTGNTASGNDGNNGGASATPSVTENANRDQTSSGDVLSAGVIMIVVSVALMV